MLRNGYCSRNIPSYKVYEDVYTRRIQAKKAGDKVTANSYKLILNTAYGATLNKYNDLYDPLMARSVCISGQLYLMELTNHLYQDIPKLRVISTNTDGIMVEFDEEYIKQVTAIVDEWQVRTGFTLEEDQVKAIYQGNVNNYIEIAADGSVKKKGGYVVRGIAPAGAFNINNNAIIVAEAIEQYFVNGIEPEETINACNDIFRFQIVAKAGSKYREAYHLVDGQKVPVQKVNRIYASKDTRYGRIYKVKAENDSEAKIDSLPEHCIIDNSAVTDPNHIKVDAIDKQWYIDLAHKRINDFKGIQPEKIKKVRTRKVATEKQTVLEKLLTARKLFLERGVKKSGVNNQMEFTYFELTDIIPIATPIFEEVGILPVVRMDSEMAYMDVVNTANKEDKLTFSIPLAKWEGNRGVNPIQVMGATVTYYRRYLYQLALDIVERDEIDDKPQVVVAPEKPTKPATPQQRIELKAELTNADGQADELQLTQLKKTALALKQKAKGTDAEKGVDEWLAKLAIETHSFTKISKTMCAEALTHISSMMEAMNEQ